MSFLQPVNVLQPVNAFLTICKLMFYEGVLYVSQFVMKCTANVLKQHGDEINNSSTFSESFPTISQDSKV